MAWSHHMFGISTFCTETDDEIKMSDSGMLRDNNLVNERPIEQKSEVILDYVEKDLLKISER